MNKKQHISCELGETASPDQGLSPEALEDVQRIARESWERLHFNQCSLKPRQPAESEAAEADLAKRQEA